MKTYILTFSISLFATFGFAQTEGVNTKYALKLYNLTRYDVQTNVTILNDSSGLSSENTQKSLQILHPTIAFQWKSAKNNFHEVELTSFLLNKTSEVTNLVNNPNGGNQVLSGSDVISTKIAMRYEFILNLSKSKDWKFSPSVGFGVSPYFNRMSSTPKTANVFPSSETSMGISGFVIPRLTYFMTSRLFLDINLPISLIDLNVLTSIKSDPLIPLEERTLTTVNFQQFAKQFSGRIGIGIKL